MKNLKASKILGGVISVISILGLVAFALGMQSMFSVIQTGIPGGETNIELNLAEPIVIHLNPTNTGLLDTTLSLSMEFILDGERVAYDELAMIIPAGAHMPTELELEIPQSELNGTTPDTEFQVVTVIRVASLFDLISFDNTLIIDGGAE